jgi:cell shape-determining protein MreC
MKRSSFLRARGIGRGVRLLNPASVRGGVIVLLVILVLVVVRVAFPNVFVALFTPLWKTGDVAAASVGGVETFFSDKHTLAYERDNVAKENAVLVAENDALKARVSDLTKLLGSRTEGDDGVLAGVLARPPVSPYDVLVVDSGEREGVHTGALVYGAGGVPLGTVAATTERAARVLLYSSPGKETAAWAGDTRIPLTIVGEGSGAFYSKISRDAGVVAGMSIYVAGPGALPVGEVVAVEANPAATEVRVRIRPITNPFSITWVTISQHAGL